LAKLRNEELQLWLLRFAKEIANGFAISDRENGNAKGD
jgi:hypothetical protein